MESNMKGFKFYEKHCMKTVTIFFMSLLIIILFQENLKSIDHYNCCERHQTKTINDLRCEIKVIKTQLNKGS